MSFRLLSQARSRIAVCVVVLAACAGAAAQPAESASSGTVVGATVPSATTFDDTGCRSDTALELGLVPVSTWSIGAACTLQFGSSNDTSRIRAWQFDRTGTAMESHDGTWTARSGAGQWFGVAASANAPLTAWISGSGGPGEAVPQLLKTTDGGTTWSSAGLSTCAASWERIRNVDSYDDGAGSDLLWSSTATRICRSTDGGATWTTNFTLGSGTINFMKMVSRTRGYAVTNTQHLLRTTDGTTWTDVGAVPYTDLPSFQAVHADATGTRIVIAARQSVLPTSSFGAIWSDDGGATWSERVLGTNVGVDRSGVYGVLVVDANTLLASLPYTGTWRAAYSAGSWTWTKVHTSTRAGVPYVRTGDGAIFWQLTTASVARSTDGGQTWTVLPTGSTLSNAHLWAIAGNGNHLYTAGQSSARLASHDGAATWSAEAMPTWYAVVAWDAARFVVAGTVGAARRSTNGGASFADVPLGTTSTIAAGIALPDGVGVLVGDSSTIRRTSDYGATWSTISSPTPTNWTEATVDDAGVAWIVSATGKVASSTDQGASWTLQTDVPGASGVASLSAWRGQIWVGGASGGTWRASTATRPLSWTSVPVPRTATVRALWAIDATTAVAISEYEPAPDGAYLSRTVDGGATWSATKFASNPYPRALNLDPSHRVAWIGGSGGTAFRSDDRGLPWGPAVVTSLTDYVYRIAVTGAGRLIAAGKDYGVATSAPGTSIPDGMAGASGFGACLETASGTNSTQWSPAGAGACSSATPAVWNAIALDPTAPTASVATTSANALGTLVLRFGLHTGPSTTAGNYGASVVFEVVAPAA